MISQIKKAINTSINRLGDLAQTVTLKHETGSEFDPSTGQHTTTYSEHSCKILVQDYTISEISNSNGAIATNDRKVLLPVDQLSFVPVSGKDKIVIGSSEQLIKDVRRKLQSLYVVQI